MTGQADDVAKVQARLLQTLYELSTSARRGLDPGDLVRLVADHAGELLHGDAVAVYLLDDPRGLLLPVYTNDQRQPLSDRPLRAGEGATGAAVEQRQTVVVLDYPHYTNAVEWAIKSGLHACEAVPLLVTGRAIGALVVRFYGERPSASADDERILNLLAALAAPALEAARLYATSTLEREHERALREITQTLAENLDERHVLQLAVQQAAQLLRSPYARVWLFLPSGDLMCAAASGYVSRNTFSDLLVHESTSGLAAQQQLVNLANAPTEPGWRFNRDFGERTGLGAYLGAGLWRAGESVGVLEVMRQAGHRYREDEEQLLVTLANTVAVAVSNARTHAAMERLAAEAEQRAASVVESERVLRSVYEAIGSGVLVMDTSGTVVTANAAAEEILGYPASRLVGKAPGLIDLQLMPDGALVPVGERPSHRVADSRTAERKLIYSFVHPDHRRRWLQLDAVPLFGPDGEVTRVVSSFIDITEQKQSEEALRRRDAILQAVAFAAEKLLTRPEWEQSIDEVLGHLGVATGVSRVYIVPSSDDASDGAYHEWIADGVARRADPPRQGSYLERHGLTRWDQVLRSGGIIQGQLRSFPVDEQVKLRAQGVCSVVAVPIFAGSEWWGFIGFDDCNEERSWQANLVEALKTAARTLAAAIYRRRAEAERLQLVREQSARVEAEAAQRRLAFLAEASQILAASLDYETSLQGIADLLVPELTDAAFIDIVQAGSAPRRVAAAGTPEATRLGSSLHVAEVIASAHPHLARRELIVPLVTRAGVTGALTWLALPSRPAFQATDLDLAEHLARRCALALDNSRLYREARSAVSLRDEFLSVAAHELKTPMTSLRGYAQLLAREFARGGSPDPDRARRAADTIQVQSDKLARLVAQLLDVSRLQSGKLAIERAQTDISKLLRDVVETARAQLKDHTLVARLPGTLWGSIDPLRIEQVVTNLIDNAIKYSPDGGQIDVALECDRASDGVRIVVRDRGVGVPPEHRAHIFDRFYQAHAGGPLTSMAGMGLGLYISRQIVELHDGTIEAEHPEDGGTRFVVTLPSAVTEVADRRHREAHPPSD